MTLEELQYPIGQFEKPSAITREQIAEWVESINTLPLRLKREVCALSEAQLETPYRAGAWTIRQLVHHVADSHMNGFIRFKLALTEDNPVIKPYDQNLWVALEDSRSFPVAASLRILEGLHARWYEMLKSLDNDALRRTFYHPEHEKYLLLDEVIGNYAWHGNHHLAHIKLLTTKWEMEAGKS